MKALKIKVCGMRNSDNIKGLEELRPDMMGLIFVKKSIRYIDDIEIPKINNSIKKIGVFQNHKFEEIIDYIKKYDLDGVQLHGNESAEFCSLFKGKIVIKCFSPSENFNWDQLKNYIEHTDYFLFDTKINGKSGGTGKKFNWKLIEEYTIRHPFLLSGGINPNDAKEILSIKNPNLIGVDLNSGFEGEGCLKNIEVIKQFQKELFNPYL